MSTFSTSDSSTTTPGLTAPARPPLQAVATFGRMVKFSHTVFAIG